MAAHQEFEPQQRPVEEIPESPQIPPELEQGLKTIPTTHTNIPQVSDDANQQIVAHPAPADPSGPNIVLPADPQVFTHQAKGSDEDTQTWNAWFWLRMVKKAISHHINIIVGNNEVSK